MSLNSLQSLRQAGRATFIIYVLLCGNYVRLAFFNELIILRGGNFVATGKDFVHADLV